MSPIGRGFGIFIAVAFMTIYYPLLLRTLDLRLLYKRLDSG